jgi:hypothetical protein
MNALVAPAAVTSPVNVDRAEYGFECPAVYAAVLEQGERFTVNDGQSRSGIAGATELDMRLQEESLDLAALRILLLLDQMERQLKRGRRGHPPLQIVELEARGAIGMWRSRARGSGKRHNTYGTLTVRILRMATPDLSKRGLQRI